MNSLHKYRSTLFACYASLFMQAFCVNCTAILFVSLQTLYGLTFTELGALIFINFFVQLVIDFSVASSVDKYGFKPFVLSAPIMVAIGTLVFILAPVLLDKPYPLFVVGTIIFATASGLLEVIVSPIVDNLPTLNKAKAMSTLHGYYGVGQIFVVVITSVLIWLLGMEKWQYVMSVFLVLPVVVFFVFLKAPLIDSRDNQRNLPYKAFLSKKIFWLYMLAISTAAMTELIMAQWSSTFFETALGVPKIVGDILAVSAFAVFFTAGRLLYGKFGHKVDLSNVCIWGAALCAVCYVVVGVFDIKALSIIGCALCGLGVSMLWPGTLTLATERFKGASTKLFGTLSGAGDMGAAIGPVVVGLIADNIASTPAMEALADKFNMTAAQFGLKAGLLFGAVASLIAVITHIVIKNNKKKCDTELPNN